MKLRLALAVWVVGSAAVCRAEEGARETDAAMESLAAHSAQGPLYHSLTGLPGGAGCCESPFDCCQDVWDGYCDEQRCCPLCGHRASGPMCWLSCRKYRDRHFRQERCSSQCCTPGHTHGDVVEVVVSETVTPTPPTRPEPVSLHTASGRKATQSKGNHRVSCCKTKMRR